MSTLIPTEYQNQRILTTQQLADGYGTVVKVISYNFNNNKERYQEGKHYFCLEKDELKAFREIHELPLNINKLYLWTEKGALLHAKSLNTDKAWEVYDRLVETYFKVQTIAQQTATVATSTISPDVLPIEVIKSMVAYVEKHEYALRGHEQKILDHDSRIASLEEERTIKEDAIICASKSSKVSFYVKNNLYSPTAIGYSFGFSGRALNLILHERGIQEPIGKGSNAFWIVLRKFRHLDYAMQLPRTVIIDGKPQPVKVIAGWTEKGAKFICNLLKEIGYEQITELNNKIVARELGSRKASEQLELNV